MSLLTTSSANIQHQLNSVDAELNRLPGIHPCVPQSMGYSSRTISPAETLFIELHFQEAAPVDLIVLMPTVFKGKNNQRVPYLFPEQFLLERILEDGSSEMIADHRKQKLKIEGPEPQLFHCPTVKSATGIRLTIPETPGNDRVTLSEIFAFAGQWNAALNATVVTSSHLRRRLIWNPSYLVDGVTPFRPIKQNTGNKENFYRTYSNELMLLFDLGASYELDEARFWPMINPDHNNSPFTAGLGFPTQIKLEVLSTADSTNATTLYKATISNPTPGSNPFPRRLEGAKGRYVKLTLSNGFLGSLQNPSFRPRIILSEIEFLGKGHPITETKILQPTPNKKNDNLAKLTDGLTSDGEILPLRQWLEQLNRRHKLLRRRAHLKLDLERTLQQEKDRVDVLIIIATALIIILSLGIWIVRLLAVRKNAKMREQIAADLHDEVGANLSSIAHISELAKERVTEKDEVLNELLDDTIEAARSTAAETSHFVRFLEKEEMETELTGHISNVALQILGDIDHSCTFDAARPLNQLNPAREWDLLFFVKEALNNIIKHADADHVDIMTRQKGAKVQLIIEDNGCGIQAGQIPPRHLESRAKRLKGDLTVETAPGQGTRITLTLNKRKIR